MQAKEARTRLHRLLHVISRPARRGATPGGLVVYPYRGYGSRREIFLMGRVFRQAPRSDVSGGTLGDDLKDLARRMFQRGVAGVRLAASLNGTQQRLTSDRDGYFRFHMRLAQPALDSPSPWQTLPIHLAQTGATSPIAHGQILVPPPQAQRMVISDIDDTVIFTGVANKLMMLVRLFTQGAQSRVAFPGTAALYRALHHGRSGAEMNPMLYVSRSPWGLYEVLDEFFNLHGIPIGPVLFLREWGLSAHRPFPRRSKGHKIALIRRMMEIHSDLPCVLIGDSGQHDPEIYARLVKEYPGRIGAVYIRNVGASNERFASIESLAKEVAGQGSALFLAADAFAMAEHMAREGLISKNALGEVLAERVQQTDGIPLQSTRKID
jgi:phosphatidate phosphatase APP1